MYKINKTQRILQMSCQFLYFFYNTGPNLAQILLLCVTAVLGGNDQLGTKNRNFSRLYNFIFRTGQQLKLLTLIECPQHISLQISKTQQQQQKKQTNKQTKTKNSKTKQNKKNKVCVVFNSCHRNSSQKYHMHIIEELPILGHKSIIEL